MLSNKCKWMEYKSHYRKFGSHQWIYQEKNSQLIFGTVLDVKLIMSSIDNTTKYNRNSNFPWSAASSRLSYNLQQAYTMQVGRHANRGGPLRSPIWWASKKKLTEHTFLCQLCIRWLLLIKFFDNMKLYNTVLSDTVEISLLYHLQESYTQLVHFNLQENKAS